jgi:uncharacterized membrane protein HdeD (DUF308 family)
VAAHRKWLVPLAVILGIALIAVGIVYFVEPAPALPSFFPGHQTPPPDTGVTGPTHHHTKHGIAAILLGLACFAFAWFNTGPKKNTE